MTDEKKLVLKTDLFRVEEHEGGTTVVFTAVTGEEVLFQRRRSDDIVAKVSPLVVERDSLAAARLIAIKQLPSHFRVKGLRHTEKVVQQPVGAPSKPVKKPAPMRLSKADAAIHDLRISAGCKED